jgi:hypothetical protein
MGHEINPAVGRSQGLIAQDIPKVLGSRHGGTSRIREMCDRCAIFLG